MRYAVAFLIGAVVGATCLFLFLQESGRLAIPSAPAIKPRISSTTTPAEPALRTPASRAARTAAAPEPPTVPDGESIAIPVAGITKDKLRDHFNDLRGGTRSHDAIDIMAPRGTPVLAIADGKVTKLFVSKPGGITLYQSDPTGKFIYYYAHLDRYAPGVREGLGVRKGQLLGYVGATGNASPSAPHLHFAIQKVPSPSEWWKGVAVNPYPVLMRSGVTFTEPVAAP